MAKIYSSYNQIDSDLEILKMEREIHLQKILLNVEKTKDAFQPENLFREALVSFKNILSNSYGMLLNPPTLRVDGMEKRNLRSLALPQKML